jgi:acetoacetyl-CoA synthetase
VWLYTGIIADSGSRGDHDQWSAVVQGFDRMAPPDPVLGPRWFPGARLNFAENLLRRRDEGAAIIFRGEDGSRRQLTFSQLHEQAARAAAALLAAGVGSGDRVAGFLPNIPETVIAMLGAAWIGAVWSSCSPDFGTESVLDRFGQIEPRVLFISDGYRYNGKTVDVLSRGLEIARRLPCVEHVVIVPFHTPATSVPDRGRAVVWSEWTSGSDAAPPFARLPFDHPLYVMYSSGTTGLPKCMVHGAGGTLIQHLKEHRLHVDLRQSERIFYFTTCGWMMWNWLVSALATGASIVLYDGAPLPEANPSILWDTAAEENVAVFGTSAKFLALSEKAGLMPRFRRELTALRTILSTGSPLAPASFDYVERDVRPGVRVESISGGTDLISCFALGIPILPIVRGELQGPGLGMAVDVFDANGQSVREVPGELVCTRPFPSMPVSFWNDPDGSRYRRAYFEFFPGTWRHGDWAEITSRGGLVIHGRSDATLNPGGVRIGTAEIYRVVEQFEQVMESVVIGQEISDDGSPDVRIVLFVRMRRGVELSPELVSEMQQRIRKATSPHHVPRLVFEVHDIPRTVNGKITELAVREAFHGREVSNLAAMANPEALEEFRKLGIAEQMSG